MTNFEKIQVATRYMLLGMAQQNPDYYVALEAMEFASNFHDGTRKDGVTPEFQHQLGIFSYLRTMHHHLELPAQTFAAAFLHDVAEDYDIGFDELEQLFGVDIALAVRLLTKKHRGATVPADTYFDLIAENPVASVVKGADRINNLQSMLGVFSAEKQASYCEEAQKRFLPMLKVARRRFPRQEAVYENIKLMMKSQITLISAIHGWNAG